VPQPRACAVGPRYAPGGEGGIGHGLTDLFLFLQNVPSEAHGGACGGDSGSPVFLGDTNQLVAVHTGGYRLPVSRRAGMAAARVAIAWSVHGPEVMTTRCWMPSAAAAAPRPMKLSADSPASSRVLSVFSIAP
jgi:hypothetical protein